MTTFDCVNPSMLKITEYELLSKLPNPFVFDNGDNVKTKEDWIERRKEIYKTAIELQYGTQPPCPEFLEVETLYKAKNVCTYLIHTGKKLNPVSFRMQVVLPQNIEGIVPFIVDGDQCWMYHMSEDYLNAALNKGIGWVFFDRTELAHDIVKDSRGNGALYSVYPEYTFGALGAWAWGYSRCVDALEKLDLPIDFDYLTFAGHSRGGKTCALAGALDERAKIVNPNSTCAGACGCYRIHMKGIYESEKEWRSETLKDLLTYFEFWMGPEMKKYEENEKDLPFDTHFLKAMIAPRTLFISESAGDLWANPVGSYQTTIAAKEVFDFLGATDNVFWYFRPGFHFHDVSDVQMLVNVIKHKQTNEKISDRMFVLPFVSPEPTYDWKSPQNN